MAKPVIFTFKTFSATYANQPLSLGAFEPPRKGEELGQGDIRLCPVRVLKAYIEMTAGFQQSDSLSLNVECSCVLGSSTQSPTFRHM
ncbi:hypothetical protein N1851_031042 [Merluccius polli]|uniref:Uncharacterized protein n=1 Tax=Merluccius polli TaxID=89951 RepID=A0AA47NR78_MERPO|nr:hypothetical protein N1851_031042 [Merluccius polli]